MYINVKNNYQQIDSLKTALSNLQKSNFTLKINEAPVQAALIIGTITLLTVILGFIFKDFLIPNWLARQNKRKTGKELFARYKPSLLKAAFSFNNRIYEIYRTRSHYLWNNTSLNAFYDYKYKSSVYRLCVLLGWIRAFRLAESSMTVQFQDKSLNKIYDCLFVLESALADGQRIEMSLAKAILNIANVNINSVNQDVLLGFSIEIDHLLHLYTHEHKVNYVADLMEDQQNKLIVDIQERLQSIIKQSNIPTTLLELHKCKKLIIKELSIKLAFIYRDWQQAIGDLMIKKDDGCYEVISFKIFEEYWDQHAESTEKKWLKRAEIIFENLDMRVDRKSETRIEQLELIYSSTYSLIKILFETRNGLNPFPKKTFREIKKSLSMEK